MTWLQPSAEVDVRLPPAEKAREVRRQAGQPLPVGAVQGGVQPLRRPGELHRAHVAGRHAPPGGLHGVPGVRVDHRQEGHHCCRHGVLIPNNCLLQQGQFPLLTN